MHGLRQTCSQPCLKRNIASTFTYLKLNEDKQTRDNIQNNGQVTELSIATTVTEQEEEEQWIRMNKLSIESRTMPC